MKEFPQKNIQTNMSTKNHVNELFNLITLKSIEGVLGLSIFGSICEVMHSSLFAHSNNTT